MTTRAKAGIFKPKVFLTLEPVDCPKNITEAFADPLQKQAAQDEFDALVKFGTWEMVPLPIDRKTIGCKWLFKKKTHADGALARRKGRLVAKGYSQEAGSGYNKTFSPVIKAATVRILLTLAVTNNWKLHQVD